MDNSANSGDVPYIASTQRNMITLLAVDAPRPTTLFLERKLTTIKSERNRLYRTALSKIVASNKKNLPYVERIHPIEWEVKGYRNNEAPTNDERADGSPSLDNRFVDDDSRGHLNQRLQKSRSQ